jgi:hypothetical protein
MRRYIYPIYTPVNKKLALRLFKVYIMGHAKSTSRGPENAAGNGQ